MCPLPFEVLRGPCVEPSKVTVLRTCRPWVFPSSHLLDCKTRDPLPQENCL